MGGMGYRIGTPLVCAWREAPPRPCAEQQRLVPAVGASLVDVGARTERGLNGALTGACGMRAVQLCKMVFGRAQKC